MAQTYVAITADKLVQFNETSGDWEVFPTAPTGLNVAVTKNLWADPNNKHITIYRGDGTFGHWDGASWSYVTATGMGSAAVEDMHGLSSNEIYAVTVDSEVWKWNGTAWSKIQDFLSGAVFSWKIWVINSSDIWVVGGNGGNQAFHHYNGSTWTNLYSQASTDTGLSLGLTAGVWAADSNNVFLVTTALGSGDSQSHLLKYNGSTFSDLGGLTGWEFIETWGVNSNNVWIAGYNSGDVRFLYWNGSTLSTQLTTTGGDNSSILHHMIGKSTNDIMLVTGGTSALGYESFRYNGSAWNEINNIYVTGYFEGVTLYDPTPPPSTFDGETYNVLKGVVTAAAQEANEAGGQLITRLREAHIFGQDNASLATANPTRLTSPSDVFSATDIGKIIDIIEPYTGAPSGFEGSYIIDTYIDPTNVALTTIDGNAPSFTDTNPVRWRLSTLRVETTIEFPKNDALQRLWVSEEDSPVDYAVVDQTVKSQEFKGLGSYRQALDGETNNNNATTLSTATNFFVSSDVGKTVWIQGDSADSGPYRIIALNTVIGGPDTVTINPAITLTQDGLKLQLKTYDSDSGYLTKTAREDAEVIDGSGAYSSTDRLRRALLVDYATEEELDRIGRNYGLTRPLGLSDDTFRRVLKVLPYAPRGTEYGLELLLNALFPNGGWSIFEDLVAYPNIVFIDLPTTTIGTESEGRAFLNPAGLTNSPINNNDYGTGGREKTTSTNSTTVSITHEPISVVDVLLEPLAVEQTGTALPTFPWAFDAQNSGIEGNYFNLNTAYGAIQQTAEVADGDDNGSYSYPIDLGNATGSYMEMSAFFRIESSVTEQGEPWSLYISDNKLNKQYGLWWNSTTLYLQDSAGSGVGGSYTFPSSLTDGKWHHFKIRRETVKDQHLVSGWFDNLKVFNKVDLSTFSAAPLSDRAWFGYQYQVGTSQEWVVHWDRIRIINVNKQNYWNSINNNGTLPGGSSTFTTASSTFQAGDEGKVLRIISGPDKNVGRWRIRAYNSATSVELEAIDLESLLTVHSDTVIDPVTQLPVTTHYIDSLDPWFIPEDVGKSINISSALPENDGNRIITEYVSPWRIKVDGSNFNNETNLTGRVFPGGTYSGVIPSIEFTSDSNIVYELVDVGTNIGTTLTLRAGLPGSTVDVQIGYTAVLSAQLLRNEFVRNEGSGGTTGNVYYPLYLFDVDRATRELISSMTAAGVLPEYERKD